MINGDIIPRPSFPAERRIHRHYYEDGLPDLFLGCFGVIGGVLLLSLQRSLFVAAVVLLLPAPLVWLLGKALLRAKVRFSDQRTGYVRYGVPRLLRGKRFWVVVLATSLVDRFLVRPVFSWANTRLVREAPELLAWRPALFALLFVVVSIGQWRSTGYARYLPVAAVALAAGLAGPAAGLEEVDSVALLFVAFDLSLLVVGSFAFRSFLRHHPLPSGE